MGGTVRWRKRERKERNRERRERNGRWREGREQGAGEKERQRDSNDWPEE